MDGVSYGHCEGEITFTSDPAILLNLLTLMQCQASVAININIIKRNLTIINTNKLYTAILLPTLHSESTECCCSTFCYYVDWECKNRKTNTKWFDIEIFDPTKC